MRFTHHVLLPDGSKTVQEGVLSVGLRFGAVLLNAEYDSCGAALQI